MRRLLPMLAVAATVVGLAGAATAHDRHGGPDRGRGWEHGGGRGEAPPWARGEMRGPAPGWTRREVGPPPPERGYYGPPPGYYEPRGYLRRGGRLPPDVRGEVVPNPGRYRLRPPPRGFNWVRVGNAFALMNMETGQLFDIIPD